LLSAAFCTSLALLTKQEFGLTCLATLGFEAVASSVGRRSWGDLLKTGLACGAGLLPAVAVYTFLIWKLSARAIFIDNWVMTPGTYIMKRFGPQHMAKAGFRFGLAEW